MENRIISEFKGLINNIEIKDESNYNSTLYILEKINEKFGEKYNDDFIKDLSEVIQTLYIKYDEFSYSILENDFRSSIEDADNFNDIKFEYYGSTWKIDTLNERIKEGEYVKESKIDKLKKMDLKECPRFKDKMIVTAEKLNDMFHNYNEMYQITFGEKIEAEKFMKYEILSSEKLNNCFIIPGNKLIDELKLPIEKLEMWKSHEILSSDKLNKTIELVDKIFELGDNEKNNNKVGKWYSKSNKENLER